EIYKYQRVINGNKSISLSPLFSTPPRSHHPLRLRDSTPIDRNRRGWRFLSRRV
ncbi:MAG: hypothetical protein, partial [Olavius algarvensis Gamma 1 endosymbiont]